MVKTIAVHGPTLARIAMVLVLETSRKPSTWFPPERLVELPEVGGIFDTRWEMFSFKT